MRCLCIIHFLLISLLLSCTSKNDQGSQLPQAIPEISNFVSTSVYTPPVDDTIIIGGFRTSYKLSRPSRTYLITIGEDRCADFSGIEQLVHMEILNLYLWETNDIDFTPLKSLPKLRFIDIRGSALTEIPDLSNISSLSFLELDYNSLTNLNGLEKIPQLELLHILDARVPITNTSALHYLINLQELYIINSSFSIDFINLANSPHLTEMLFSNCGELDLYGIGQLKQLKKLRLEIGVSKETGKQSAFKNIQEIGKMSGLKELYLDELITSVEFLANNVNLERLELIAGKARPGAIYYSESSLPLLDVAPLAHLNKLKYLAVRGFELINAHVLDTLPELGILDTALFTGDH
jgi:internalin A